MKQFAEAFEDGKLASGGDASNGAALPSAADLLGDGNDTSLLISSSVSLKSGEFNLRNIMITF